MWNVKKKKKENKPLWRFKSEAPFIHVRDVVYEVKTIPIEKTNCKAFKSFNNVSLIDFKNKRHYACRICKSKLEERKQ